MVFRYLLYAFLLYLLYRLVFHFIIPVYKTTRQVKKQFRDMHGRMEDYMNQQAQQQPSTPKQETGKGKAGDYIDFEEVK
jgi:hypothetical protein